MPDPQSRGIRTGRNQAHVQTTVHTCAEALAQRRLGAEHGLSVEDPEVGEAVGEPVGPEVGLAVGLAVGREVGTAVGAFVGFLVLPWSLNLSQLFSM